MAGLEREPRSWSRASSRPVKAAVFLLLLCGLDVDTGHVHCELIAVLAFLAAVRALDLPGRSEFREGDLLREDP